MGRFLKDKVPAALPLATVGEGDPLHPAWYEDAAGERHPVKAHEPRAFRILLAGPHGFYAEHVATDADGVWVYRRS